MTTEFSILGRGRAGSALAEALGPRVRLLPHGADPAGPVLLAVPDAAIEVQAARFPGRCAHLSGSLHLPGVPCLHPLTSFDGQARDWRDTPLAVTGDPDPAILGAFLALGFLPFPLRPEAKALYHACAVLSSAHAATLWLGGAELMRAAGVDMPGEGFLPLARATLDNIARLGAAGRTGPFVRGDLGTIRRDAEALPEPWRGLFLALGALQTGAAGREGAGEGDRG